VVKNGRKVKIARAQSSYGRSPNIILFSQLSRTNKMVQVEGCHKETFKGNGNFLGGCK